MRVPAISSFIMCIWYAYSIPRIQFSFVSLIVEGTIGFMIYGAILWVAEKKHISEIVKGFVGK